MITANKVKRNCFSVNELKPEDLTCSGCGITCKPSDLSLSEKRRVLKRLGVIQKTGGRFSQFTKEEFACKNCKMVNIRKLQCVICRAEKLIHLFYKDEPRNRERGYCIKCTKSAQEESVNSAGYENISIQNFSSIHTSNINQHNNNQLANSDKNSELENTKCKICNSICRGHLCCYFCSTTMPKYRFLTVDNNIEVCHYCLKNPKIVTIINTICEEIKCFICKNKWRIHAFDKDQRNKSDKACCKNCINNTQKELLTSLNNENQTTSSSSNTIISSREPESIQSYVKINTDDTGIQNLIAYGKNSSLKDSGDIIRKYSLKHHILCSECKRVLHINPFAKNQRKKGEKACCKSCMKNYNVSTTSSSITRKTLYCVVCETIWDINAFDMDQRNNRDEACCRKCFEYNQKEDEKSLETDDSDYEP
ncbi:hypothetical protein CONCODRAFT_78524 [Conidiobolus coronatus NRRL 28638]|uniref:Stc1 domain-containing protein n=1 Tax=Conidiobolus coronatus (strain ATCC 28846 / CBS 209.66 / NRRL 28638) TaxID=796925 RepID=A0A137P7V8_CONC2|nr:hypothetical protein CONCODRAFT_78524 [Conidiobolus coronatus NRRL 28638]|eukprot:KXN71090.1 hypothetical protein CONCODRAFT_78524 [Conidiobolus coronatus NRRL 28638]